MSKDYTLKIYNQTIKDLETILAKLNFQKISLHNKGYLSYEEDPVYHFCHAEKKRLLMTINFMLNHGLNNKSHYLDLGTFIPIVPLMVKKIGASVDAVEKFSLYDDSLNSIVDLMRGKNINVHNLDIINDDISKEFPNNYYDFISCEAIIEHLCGSPVNLLQNARKLLKPTGVIIVVVPNVACLSKRINFFLRGIPPFPSIETYLTSQYPFTGHNREYNFRELRYLLNNLVGFKEIKLKFFNVKLLSEQNWKLKILDFISLFHRRFRDAIWYAGKK